MKWRENGNFTQEQGRLRPVQSSQGRPGTSRNKRVKQHKIEAYADWVNTAEPSGGRRTGCGMLKNGTNSDIFTNTTGSIFIPPATETFTCDADGNLKTDGRWTNSWDAENRLISMQSLTNGDLRLQQIQHSTISAQLSAVNYSYDAEGQINTWTQQADVGTTNLWSTGYDAMDQLLSVAVRSNSIAGALLKQFVYAYDKAGNRTSESIQTGASFPLALATASYNSLNQLTAQSAGGSIRVQGHLSETGAVSVAGSAAGITSNTNFLGFATGSTGTNTVQITATDLSNNSATNRYQIIVTNNGAATTLSYDLNGNLISAISGTSTKTYEWDGLDRLTKITQSATSSPQLISEFTYNGFGHRVRMVEKTNGVVQSDKRFLWSGGGPSEERDSTGASVTKRFFGSGEQISGTNYFFSRDHLGSIREMTDATGAIRARYDYDPYGRRAKISGDRDADFGFTGHYIHLASGLCLALFRAYDSQQGRWLSRDPLSEAAGMNLYAYVLNNPLVAVDILGLCAEAFWNGVEDSALIGLGAVAAGVGLALVFSPVVLGGIAIGAVLASIYFTGKAIGEMAGAYAGGDEATGDYLQGSLIGAGAFSLVGLGFAKIPASATPPCAAESGASSAANAARLRSQLTAEEIAGGHAFDKHVIQEGQFPGSHNTSPVQQRNRERHQQRERDSVSFEGPHCLLG